MPATLTNGPGGATRLYLPRYSVYREHRQIDVDYHLQDDAGQIVNTGTEQEPILLTGSVSIKGEAFDLFYPTWTSDLQLYGKVMDALDLDGTVDLGNEPG